MRYDEKTVCENSATDCTCGRIYHINEKPNKCYFYKKKPNEKGRSAQKPVDLKSMRKVKAMKNKINNDVEDMTGNGYLIKIGGMLIEDIELTNQEFEYHLKVGLSILESNKNRIKTNYANYFNIEVTILPNIRDLLKDFGILKDLYELFDSIAKADFAEVLDEFEELNKLIHSYKQTNRLVLSDEESERPKSKKVDKDEISKRNTNYLNQLRKNKNERGAQKSGVLSPEHKYAYVDPIYIFRDRLYLEDFDASAVEQFYKGEYMYGEFVPDGIRENKNIEELEKVINLAYREKNYYYLKKAAVKKKKIKKEAKAIIVNESMSGAKKKKKKKTKKKKADGQDNGSVISNLSELIKPSVRNNVDEPKDMESTSPIPNIKNDTNCGVLELKFSAVPLLPESDMPVVQLNKKLIIDETKLELINVNEEPVADKSFKRTSVKNKSLKIDLISNDIAEDKGEDRGIAIPTNENFNNEILTNQHNKSLSIKAPAQRIKVNMSRMAHRNLRERSEGYIISDHNKRSFTLNSDYDPSTNFLKHYSDYSHTNNNSFIREMSIEKSNHIIHHRIREKTRRKNNRTIEKKLKKKEISIERRFNKLNERTSRVPGLRDMGDVPDIAIRKNSEDKLTVSDAKNEHTGRVTDMVEVAADPPNEDRVRNVINKSLQEEFEWIREEKNHVVKNMGSSRSAKRRNLPYKEFNNGIRANNKSADKHEEFLEMIKREKLESDDLNNALKNSKNQVDVNLQPDKANKKKKKKKKKKAKQVEEQPVVYETNNDIQPPKKDQINVPMSSTNQVSKPAIENIDKEELGFDINSDAYDENDFTKMVELLESKTNRGLGPEIDKQIYGIVEGMIKSL